MIATFVSKCPSLGVYSCCRKSWNPAIRPTSVWCPLIIFNGFLGMQEHDESVPTSVWQSVDGLIQVQVSVQLPFHSHQRSSPAILRSTSVWPPSNGLRSVWDMYPLDFMERNLERIVSVWLSAGHPFNGLEQTTAFDSLQLHMARETTFQPLQPLRQERERALGRPKRDIFDLLSF